MLKASPKMAKSAKSPGLEEAYDALAGQTQVYIRRLEQIFGLIGQKFETKVCKAIDGILTEGDELMETFSGEPARGWRVAAQLRRGFGRTARCGGCGGAGTGAKAANPVGEAGAGIGLLGVTGPACHLGLIFRSGRSGRSGRGFRPSWS